MRTWGLSFAIATIAVLLFSVTVSRTFGGEVSLSHLLEKELSLVLGLAAVVASFATVLIAVFERATQRRLSFAIRTLALVLLDFLFSYLTVYYFIFVVSSV